MKNFLVILFLLLPLATARAETAPLLPQTSLFFSPQEAREAELLAQKQAAPGQGDIALGAVIYYGDKDWVLWLQGQKWTPDTTREDLSVVDVSANEVHLLWHDHETGADKEINLRPDQTYQIATGKIIANP